MDRGLNLGLGLLEDLSGNTLSNLAAPNLWFMGQKRQPPYILPALTPKASRRNRTKLDFDSWIRDIKRSRNDSWDKVQLSLIFATALGAPRRLHRAGHNVFTDIFHWLAEIIAIGGTSDHVSTGIGRAIRWLQGVNLRWSVPHLPRTTWSCQCIHLCIRKPSAILYFYPKIDSLKWSNIMYSLWIDDFKFKQFCGNLGLRHYKLVINSLKF
jgi:hypothetical protein